MTNQIKYLFHNIIKIRRQTKIAIDLHSHIGLMLDDQRFEDIIWEYFQTLHFKNLRS